LGFRHFYLPSQISINSYAGTISDEYIEKERRARAPSPLANNQPGSESGKINKTHKINRYNVAASAAFVVLPHRTHASPPTSAAPPPLPAPRSIFIHPHEDIGSQQFSLPPLPPPPPPPPPNSSQRRIQPLKMQHDAAEDLFSRRHHSHHAAD